MHTEKTTAQSPAKRATPVVFPAVAIAHFAWLLYTIWDYRAEPLPSPIWVQVAWLAAYTLAWMLAWKGLRVGAWAYLALTSANLLLRFFLNDISARAFYTDALFPFDILFAFFLLLYYKRFR